MLKKGIALLILVLLSINLVLSATVIEVQQANQPEPVSHWYDFFKSPLFWGIILTIILFIIVSVAVIFAIRWIVSFIKSRNDVFYKIRKERLYLCKLHGRYADYGHFWKVSKNPPVRLVSKSETSLRLSKPIGYYRGDFISNEGNMNISLNLIGDKAYYVFPKRSLLIIPNKDKVKIKQIDSNGKSVIQEINNIPTAKDLVQFNDGEILLFIDSITMSGLFLIPVLKSKEGRIIDLSLPIFQTLKENFAVDYLYEQTDEFGRLSKRAMDINPNVRAIEKLSDSNKNIEVSDEKH